MEMVENDTSHLFFLVIDSRRKWKFISQNNLKFTSPQFSDCGHLMACLKDSSFLPSLFSFCFVLFSSPFFFHLWMR